MKILILCTALVFIAACQNIAETPKTKEQLDPNFYQSKEWRELRQRVFAAWGYNCMQCGITHKGMNIDHILPRSIPAYKHLELEFSNMQVLCRYHNQVKSNTDFTDYRNLEEALSNAKE